MRFNTKKVSYANGPNMTPMVDVVMVLLIFFMLGASFVGAEHFLKSNQSLTQAGINSGPTTGTDFDEPLSIKVDGSPRDPDKFVARFEQYVSNDKDDLARKLAGMREALNRAGKKTEKIQVLINPGRNVQYRFLVEVYEAALDAEFTKISFTDAHQ
jgi:biopolymer transport protein ExbD